MGREHGLWGPVYEQAYDHPKVRAAASVLVEEGVVPECLAVQLVVTAVNRLNLWALRDGESGRVDHLDDVRFGSVTWPESQGTGGPGLPLGEIGALMRRALKTRPKGRKRGLVVERKTKSDPYEVIHSFKVINRRLISDRKRKRTKRKEVTSEGVPRTVRGESAERLRRPTPTPNSGKTPLPTLPKRDPERLPGGGASASPPSGGGAPTSLTTTPEGRLRAEARRFLYRAQANRKSQKPRPDGRTRTLRAGSYYLGRIGDLDPGRQVRLEAELETTNPMPGMLLEVFDCKAFGHLVEQIAEPLGKADNPEAYVRSALGGTWANVLAEHADRAQEARKREIA